MLVENLEAITIEHYYCTFHVNKDVKFQCTCKLYEKKCFPNFNVGFFHIDIRSNGRQHV
jgi:hypothetical protein